MIDVMLKMQLMQIMSLYKLSSEERKELGEAGREWAVGEEAGFTAKIMGDRVINSDRYSLFNLEAS